MNGTPQGCPLSPLLFTISIEPLAAVIRNSPEVHGIQIANSHYKIGLYADNVILTLTHPQTSLPNLYKIISEYGSYSGYKINNDKSEAFYLNMTPQELKLLKLNFPFKWRDQAITYLGVHLTPTYRTLYKNNYPVQSSPNWTPDLSIL